MEGTTPMSHILNPGTQQDFHIILLADMVKPEQEEELQYFTKALGPHVLVTDKDISFGRSFNLDSTETAAMDDTVVIHNTNTYTGYDENKMNIYVSDASTYHPSDLVLEVGDHVSNKTLKTNTFYRRCGDLNIAYCGGQPTDNLSWCLFLISKETHKLTWGMHSMQWAMAPMANVYNRELNPESIFDYSV